MTISYGFYNSSGGDRVYDALQMSSIFDGIIRDGVFATIGDKFFVSENTGMQVFIGSGRAWFNHTWTYNDAPVSIGLSAADPLLPRMDVVYLEINETTRTNSFGVLTGTPASTPTQPALTNTTTIHQYRLARITVPALATSITQANIQNTVGWELTPYVTGPLTLMDNEDQVAQWEAQFVEWFDEMKDQLTTDAAGNLQTQIDDLEVEIDNTENHILSHTHLAGDGQQINTGGIVDLAVTAQKMANNTITGSQVAASLAGNGLKKPYNYSALEVSVDNDTIEIVSDSLRLKADGVRRDHLEHHVNELFIPATQFSQDRGPYVGPSSGFTNFHGYYLAFDQSTSESISFIASIPVDWVQTGTVNAFVYWFADGAGQVRWVLSFKTVNYNTDMDVLIPDYVSLSTNLPGNILRSGVFNFVTWTPDTLAITGSLIRTGGHADDTLAEDAKVIGISFRYYGI